ncbi:MAG: type II secretion system protein M [Burkholderiales bacterium]|nr:type II secretion system protein M [Burkholderiales bacterium]
MKSPTMFTDVQENLSAFWSARNEREKKQIVLAIAVAVLGLTYMLLIEPAYKGRAQLQKSLPTLRQQQVELEGLAKEATALASVTPPPAPEMTKENLEAGMTRLGLKPQSVVATGGNLAKVQFNSVSFAAMTAWLDEIQKSSRIEVMEANVTSLPQQDTVNASLTLRQQKNNE